MAIRRFWRGRPRGLRELPPEVVNDPCYADKDYWLDKALLSVDGNWIKLVFDRRSGDRRRDVHYWFKYAEGMWSTRVTGEAPAHDAGVIQPPPVPDLAGCETRAVVEEWRVGDRE
jgi:hypothetical protein